MKNITVFYLKNLNFLDEKFSIYLNRRVFVMFRTGCKTVHKALHFGNRFMVKILAKSHCNPSPLGFDNNEEE